jgi:ATP-binding cassette subfamily B protein
MRVLLRLIIFAKKYWGKLTLAFLCLLASTVFSLVVPRMLGQSIDVILTSGDRNFLLIAAAVVVSASVLRGLAGYGNTYLTQVVSQETSYDIKNALFERLQRLSFAYYDKAQTGQLMSRATVDVEAVRMFFGMGLLGITQTLILFAAITLILITLDWKLALMSLSFMPIIAWRTIDVGRRLAPIWLKIQQVIASLGTTLQESLTGARVVKAFTYQPGESQKFVTDARALYNTEIDAARQIAINMPLMTFFLSLPTALILWYGGRQVGAGDLTIGNLTQFVLYLGLLSMPVRRLGFLINNLSRVASAGQRILEILDAESQIEENPHAIQLGKVKGQITFDNVGFSYDSMSPTLKNITFTVQPGQLVALLGGSGSGKSTIANLIPRFYDVGAGRIMIDGTDIRNTTLASLRKNVGIVQQDIFLFSATIQDNIAYGAIDASMEDIITATRAAHLHDFVVSLPEGYNTWVGERGITLSGGERQRLSIARTLLVNPGILILDDSTSSVDTETERRIRQALNKLIKGRTTFIITHRLPIIKNADLILILKNGEIMEMGKHSELMALNGLYHQIYQAQLAVSEGKELVEE